MRYPILVVCALAALAAGCCKRQACDSSTAEMSISELAARPAAFLDRNIKVSGLLNNAGGNYFTDLRLELSDSGAAIAVRPWLPIEVQMRPGAGGRRPAVLSDYLGKTVRITGCLRREGDAYSLEVQQVEILAEVSK